MAASPKTAATDQRLTVMLSAGGTGGHLYPAEALAEELLKRGHRVVIVTDKRGHAFRGLGDRVDIHVVSAATLGGGILGKLKAVTRMSGGVLQAHGLLAKVKPDLVVGFGGYPSVPGVLAAQMRGIPTLLHEQNAVLGRANALLADHAAAIATSLPATRGVKTKNAAKTVTTGNPVRAAIVAARDSAYAEGDGRFNILITGGSQAARIFSDVVPLAVAQLPEDLRRRLDIVHQCREDAIEMTRRAYDAGGVKAEIKSFFNDMADRLRACQLFIGRGGASTVAEVTAVGRPAIYVPYPGHADQQQKHNAEAIAARGGGWVMLQNDFTAAALATRLTELMTAPESLAAAASAARACGETDAARKLADVVERTTAARLQKRR
jgi:UDP-N-acetylglucosamine--N-acetylmuramyl-(pentapeptide) pyrophosphoryl-undecaprenol N-acetylglucosamine transferase